MNDFSKSFDVHLKGTQEESDPNPEKTAWRQSLERQTNEQQPVRRNAENETEKRLGKEKATRRTRTIEATEWPPALLAEGAHFALLPLRAPRTAALRLQGQRADPVRPAPNESASAKPISEQIGGTDLPVGRAASRQLRFVCERCGCSVGCAILEADPQKVLAAN